MKSKAKTGVIAVLAVICGTAVTARAQNILGRLESDIRQSNGQPAATGAAVPSGQRVYLGAVALDDLGRGVRITSVRSEGPAQRGGLQAQDLVISAAGRRIHTLRELTTILGAMNPADKLKLDVLRGAQTVQLEIVLGSPPSGLPHTAERPSPPPPTGQGAGQTEAIPPPPSEAVMPRTPPAPVEPAGGPALEVPQPVTPNSAQAQIEDLRHRVDQLEQRVRELERALAEKKK